MRIGKERENSLEMIEFRIIDFVNQKKRFIFVSSILHEQTTAKARSKLVG